ncbi:MAG: hypothetical protein ABWZ15_18545 [Acidimicrobiia bacterium]
MRTELDEKIATKAEAQDGVFTLVQARALGYSEREIWRRAGKSWCQIYDGVFRMRGAPVTSHGQMRAACWVGRSPIAISHRCAAALYGVPWGRRGVIEVTCRRWERAIYPELVVHEATRFDERDIDADTFDFPVVRAEVLLLQLAALRRSPSYLEAAIHALRRGRHLTYDSTIATFSRHARRGLPGVKALRIALERWRPDEAVTQSNPELDLIQILRENGFDPVPQYRVHDENGNFVAQVDAGLPQWRITVEYESDQEHLDEFQVARDDKRRNEIVAAGYFPLAARKLDLRRGALDLVQQIERIARRHAQPA